MIAWFLRLQALPPRSYSTSSRGPEHLPSSDANADGASAAERTASSTSAAPPMGYVGSALVAIKDALGACHMPTAVLRRSLSTRNSRVQFSQRMHVFPFSCCPRPQLATPLYMQNV